MDAIEIHKIIKGKYRIVIPLEADEENLKYLYTPGVGDVAKICAESPTNTFIYTRRKKAIAVVSDGSAVLGLGNIGPYGALPVMEGKALLFKQFGDLDAFPICISTQDTEEIIKLVKALEPSFGGINLEDISAPRCFEILHRLDNEMSIPVFHDDQQGTAVVVVAGLLNALKLVKKSIEEIKIIVNGIGAAGYNIVKLLMEFGAKHIVPCDVNGIINEKTALHKYHLEVAKLTGSDHLSGSLRDALENADVFIGVSKGNILLGQDIKRMNKLPIIFALANPVPEIFPQEAYENGAFVVATGRSDFPNQINNLIAFPAIMRVAVELQKKIDLDILKLASEIISGLVVPTKDCILPKATDKYAHETLYRLLKDRIGAHEL